MAIIKKNEMKEMNEKAISEKISELNNELIRVNAQIAMGTLPENPGRIKEVRRTIARLKTMKKLKEGSNKA